MQVKLTEINGRFCKHIKLTEVDGMSRGCSESRRNLTEGPVDARKVDGN